MFTLKTSVRRKLASLGSIVGSAAALSLAPTAHAAPNMELTTLPVSDQLASQLSGQGLTAEQIADFLKTLTEVAVYDDHTNPVDTAGRNDLSRPKVYWGAPFFTPSPARSVVGAEQFANSALTIIDRIDEVMDSFAFAAKENSRLTHLRDGINDKIQKTTSDLGKPDNTPSEIANLNQLLAVLNQQLAQVQADIKALLDAATAGLAELPLQLRQSIADSVKIQFARLGITPNSQEQALLAAGNLVDGLNSMRARAGRGQLGLRQIILESGYTAKQRDVLQRYLALRPDITTKGLSVQQVSALPVAQADINENGEHEVEPSVTMIRGINIGSHGVCGNTRSCNVVVEYTEIGARNSAVLATDDGLTSIAVPVHFVAQVRAAEPDFVGSVHCKFKTGWTAVGRADVRDGNIIYDGDFTDNLHFESANSPDSGCSVDVIEGDPNSALYHTLLAIDSEYRALFGERVRDSKKAKDAYEKSIRDMLAQQQVNSQKPRGGLFGDVLGFIGGPIGGFIGGLLGSVTDTYWHTTQLNTSSSDAVEITESYNIHGLTSVSQRDFDGFALVCYAPGGGLNGVMKACPDALFDDANTETGAGEENCPERDIFDQCINNP